MPGDYREFLLAHNGGEPEPRWFAYPPLSSDFEEGGFDRIQAFHSVFLPPAELDEVRDFQSRVQYFRNELEMPKKYAPIALTFEDIVVLCCAGPKKGTVFYWSHIDAGFDTAFFVPLADTFDAFLNGLGYPTCAPWMEFIDRGDLDALRRWLQSGGKPKEEVEQIGGFSPWAYADFACQLEALELLSEWKEA